MTLFLNRRRLLHAAIVLKPSTLLHFHRLLKQSKYRFLYSSHPKRQPGPKGPAPDLIQAIWEFKRRQSALWLSQDRPAPGQNLRPGDQ